MTVSNENISYALRSEFAEASVVELSITIEARMASESELFHHSLSN